LVDIERSFFRVWVAQ